MKLEKQVTSLEISKQLEASGFSQDTIWSWVEYEHEPNKWRWSILLTEAIEEERDDGMIITGRVSAPTVAELGEVLPIAINGNDIIMIKGTGSNDNKYIVYYQIGLKLAIKFYSNNEADARGKMWLYLKKEEWIK